jgi:acyl-CoA thioesterase-2
VTTPLSEVLALEQIDTRLFRANFTQVEKQALYGGQVAAQALAAAGATVPPDRSPHSLHGYFLRPGASERPTVLLVEQDRDGRRFSARRVVAVQSGKVILSMAVSFQTRATGPEDRPGRLPEMRSPDVLPESPLRRYASTLEIRCEPVESLPSRFWVRARHALPEDDLSHASALVYLSDLSAGVRPEEPSTLVAASLDHALWIHRVPRADEWLLVDLTAMAQNGTRSLYTGSIYATDGRLCATIAQEVLLGRAEDRPRA